ncbi:MAG TPA: hypothetical protein VJ960_08385 [Oceanipulchritudo sp.]|nr:hypothetical protein [Oceanipulchritudo sp.]
MVTVYWSEWGLSMARWDGVSGGRRICGSEWEMESGALDPGSYRRVLGELCEGKRRRRMEVRWVVLTEAHPGRGGEGSCGGRSIHLPGWVWACWHRMEAGDLPAAVLSASVLMEAELMDWPEFRRPGTGICLTLEGRRFFLGHGNGAWLKRLSRGCGSGQGGRVRLDADWLRQTQALFRNRTGQDLKRVYLEDGMEVTGECPFEIIRGIKPMVRISGGRQVLDTGTHFLHASGARRRLASGSGLDFPEIRKRRNLYTWERRLRLAACGLLCGWGFLALGACHQTAPEGKVGVLEGTEVGTIRKELEGRQLAYAGMLARAGRREQPFRVIGQISATRPEGVELERIRLSKEEAAQPGLLELEIEGRFAGSDPSRVFHDWMHELRSDEMLETVRNLQFRREKRHIRFSLLGQVAGEGEQR